MQDSVLETDGGGPRAVEAVEAVEGVPPYRWSIWQNLVQKYMRPEVVLLAGAH